MRKRKGVRERERERKETGGESETGREKLVCVC